MTPASAFPGLDNPGRIAGTVIAGLVIEAAMVWRFGWRSPLGAYSFLAATGTTLSAADFAVRRVPNLIVLPAYPIAAVLLVVASAPSGWWWSLARAGIAAAGLGGFYLAIGLAFPAGMGLGDVKWAVVLGAARVAGRRQASMPMVPFMTLGAFAAVLATR